MLSKYKLEVNFMKKYVCEVCGYVYDPAIGDVEHNIPAGTDFNDLPESWTCPPCGADKHAFSELTSNLYLDNIYN